MFNRLISFRSAGCVALVVLGGCGDGIGPEPDRELRLTVISGAPANDTIFARLAEPLLVEVRGLDGRARSGVPVRFEVPSVETATGTRYLAALGRSATGALGAVVTDTTNAQGRASAYLRFGSLAGEGAVRITIPDHEAHATASFTVRAGAPVKILATPRDTAVYVGGSYTLSAALVDRFDNPHPGAVTFGVPTGQVSVSPTGVVTGLEIGRASFPARAMDLTETVEVSVVPAGTLAARATGRTVGDSVGLAVVNLDGSRFRRIVPQGIQGSEVSPDPAGAPRWDPSGPRFVYEARSDGAPRLFVADLSGNIRRLIQTPYAAISESDPVFSPDGEWIYFVGGVEEYRAALWRVRPDGTAPERLAAPADDHRDFSAISISPDGTRMVYLAREWVSENPRMYVREIATGARTQIGGIAASPKWSPGGDLIAYVGTLPYGGYAGSLRVIRLDGSGDRAVTSGDYLMGIDWSADRRFLVAYRSQAAHTPEPMRLELVDVSSGERIPLPYAARLFGPAWRR
jgi:Tol biopolymer transport system component